MDWKPSSKGNITTSDNPEPFAKEQLQAIRKVLQNTTNENKETQQGGFTSAFTINSFGSKPWVVDCGATDYMPVIKGTSPIFNTNHQGGNRRRCESCRNQYGCRIQEYNTNTEISVRCSSS